MFSQCRAKLNISSQLLFIHCNKCFKYLFPHQTVLQFCHNHNSTLVTHSDSIWHLWLLQHDMSNFAPPCLVSQTQTVWSIDADNNKWLLLSVTFHRMQLTPWVWPLKFKCNFFDGLHTSSVSLRFGNSALSGWWFTPFNEQFLKVKSASYNGWFAIRDEDVAWANFSLCLLDT